MAEIGAVYDAKPAPRTPADILTSAAPEGYEPAPGPVARNKWLTASIVNAPAEVIKRVFDEAERRDPKHRRTWVALVDGANHQIERIRFEARKREVKVTIVVDFVHVLEYLWNAAGCLHPNDDQAAAQWVHRQATRVLQGHARKVAGTIRRQATNARLDPSQRKPADEAANYLTNKAPYLDYPTALTQRLADRDRDRRRRVPPSGQGPHGHHRRPLGTRRRRSDPQATRHHRQRRLRGVLVFPPRPRTTPRPRSPLPQPHHPSRMTGQPRSLQKSRTLEHRGSWCMRIGGGRIEQAVVGALLAALTPADVKAALRAAEMLEADHDAALAQWRLQVQRARYQADRAERRYRQVEPEHRLVARGLERDWEKALGELAEAEAELALRERERPRTLTPEEREQLLALGSDLGRVWSAPTTTDGDRNQLLRCLIEEVMLDVNRAQRRTLRWRGGALTELAVSLPKPQPAIRTDRRHDRADRPPRPSL